MAGISITMEQNGYETIVIDNYHRVVTNHTNSTDTDPHHVHGTTTCIWNATETSTDNGQRTCDSYLSFISQAHIELCVLSLILCCSLASNTMAFAVFYRRPKLLSVSNRFVLNLAICNFLMTIGVIPLVIASTATGRWSLGGIVCDISGSMVTTLFCACIFTLLSISIDRYYAIVRPLHYPIRLTKKRSSIYIFIVWIMAILIGLGPLFGIGKVEYNNSMKICILKWHSKDVLSLIYTYFLTIVCFCLPFIIMLWVYVVVFRVAHRTSERARRHSVLPDICENSHSALLAFNTNKTRRNSSLTIRQHIPLKRRRSTSASVRSLLTFHRDDWKAAKTGLICMSTFSICWFPFFILITVKAASVSLMIPSWIESAVLYSALTGCILNPIVYVFRSRVVQKECKNIVSRRSSTLLGRTYTAKDLSSSGNSTPLVHMTPNRSCPIFRYSSEDGGSVSVDCLESVVCDTIDENNVVFL